MRYRYTPTTDKERLKSQADSYYKFDMAAITEAIGGRTKLTVLDLGCANGELTVSRFESAAFTKVVGVDRSDEAVDEARKSNASDKFRFYTLDLDGDFLPRLRQLMSENGIEGFDIVFGAMTAHHLSDPLRTIAAIRSVIGEGGKLILRSSDDGGKLCHPCGELLAELLYRYSKIVSTIDRHFGRKMPKLLYDAGYGGVKMMYKVTDTCNKSTASKQNMYDIGFGYRLQEVDAAISTSASSSPELAAEREWISSALDTLRREFDKPDFWYCNTTYMAIAEVR